MAEPTQGYPATQGGSPSPKIFMCRMLFPPLQAGMGSSGSPAFVLLPTLPTTSPQCWQGERASTWLLLQPAQRGPAHHRGFRVPPHKQHEITLVRNNRSPQPQALQEGERGDAGHGSKGEREVSVMLRGLNVLDPC